MLLGEVFDRFAAESPVGVTARAAFEHALPTDAVDAVFAEHAERQYTRALLFSQLVGLMGLVVCRVQPSLNAASPRGPKKPRPRRVSGAGIGHLATARVLKAEKS